MSTKTITVVLAQHEAEYEIFEAKAFKTHKEAVRFVKNLPGNIVETVEGFDFWDEDTSVTYYVKTTPMG